MNNYKKIKESNIIPLNRFTASKIVEKKSESYSIILDKAIELIKEKCSNRIALAIYIDLYHDNAKEFNNKSIMEYSKLYCIGIVRFKKYLKELADLKLINMFKDNKANNKIKIGLIFPEEILNDNSEIPESKTEISHRIHQPIENKDCKDNENTGNNCTKNLYINNNNNYRYKVVVKDAYTGEEKKLVYDKNEILEYIKWNNKINKKIIDNVNGFFRYLRNNGELDVTKYEEYKYRQKVIKERKQNKKTIEQSENENKKTIENKLNQFKDNYPVEYKKLYDDVKNKLIKENNFIRQRYNEKGETPFMIGMIKNEILKNVSE